jgi:lysophospholipase L1-like esterase
VLIIGDSIAEGWKKTQERDFPSRVVVNMGLVGEKTQELRWRLKEERPQILPKSVILIIGTNNFFDGKHSPCDVLGGIEAVESDIRSLWPDAKLYVMPIFPEGEDFSHREVDRKFINQELSLSSSGATAVSVDEEALTCRGKAIGCANYRPDHIHPTPSGYIILREGLADAGL